MLLTQQASPWLYRRVGLQMDLGALSHVGKYDRADDRPKLAMLAANVGYRYSTDDCEPILAFYIGPKIAPDDRPRISVIF